MNKSELIDAVSQSTGLGRREAEFAVNATIHKIISEVKSGNRVSIVGFGTFSPTRRGARMGRNPRTNEPVKIPPSRGVRFAAGSVFKNAVNGRGALPALKAPFGGPARSAAQGNSTAKAGPAKKAVAKKAVAKKAPAKNAVAKKAVAKKAPAKKAVAKKAVAKKAPAKKAVAKKAPAKKAVAKKAPAKRR